MPQTKSDKVKAIRELYDDAVTIKETNEKLLFRNKGKPTPKDPTPRHTFRKFMKGLSSARKLKTLRRAKTEYDFLKAKMNG